MIEMILAVTAILFSALLIEDKFGLPSPLSLIALSFFLHVLRPEIDITADTAQFATLVLTLLPVLLISDALGLKLEELRTHALSLFYLAVITVALSIATALFLGPRLFAPYHLDTAAVVVLFAMVLATDPVSVISIFSRFELPNRLKILAEGESLFNDATALIAFVFIGLYALEGGRITTAYVIEISLAVITGSTLLGIGIGSLGLMLLKTTENRIAEMMVLIFTGYAAFALAEHLPEALETFGLHSTVRLSGILACIAATLTVNHWMTKSGDYNAMRIEREEDEIQRESRRERPSRRLIASALARIRTTVAERERHMRTREDIRLLALVANTILFAAMAEIVDPAAMLRYGKEILVMFLATTVIRAAMMAKFAFLTSRTRRMADIDLRGWGVLTFAGIKGGLSIVMLSLIPADFPHLSMFKAVVIGVVLLSTFVYSSILLVLIAWNAEGFRRDVEEENQSRAAPSSSSGVKA